MRSTVSISRRDQPDLSRHGGRSILGTIAYPVTASAGARQMIGYVHSAALLRFAGQHMTQFVVPLRAGEYLKLLNEGLQARTDALLGQLDQAFRKPAAHKVNAMLLSGAITAAVSGKHGKVVELVLWTMESAEDVQARLQNLQARVLVLARPCAACA